MAASLAPYRSTRDMRVTRSLPSAPSDSTRGPLQYFNSLLSESFGGTNATRGNTADPRFCGCFCLDKQRPVPVLPDRFKREFLWSFTFELSRRHSLPVCVFCST